MEAMGMKSIKCPVCGKRGSIQRKAVPVAGKVYHYLYVAHYNGLSGNTRKIRWHYLGKPVGSRSAGRSKGTPSRIPEAHD